MINRSHPPIHADPIDFGGVEERHAFDVEAGIVADPLVFAFANDAAGGVVGIVGPVRGEIDHGDPVVGILAAEGEPEVSARIEADEGVAGFDHATYLRRAW